MKYVKLTALTPQLLLHPDWIKYFWAKYEFVHEIDRFIDSGLALLSRHATILRVSLINYSFIGKQEKETGKEQIPMG